MMLLSSVETLLGGRVKRKSKSFDEHKVDFYLVHDGKYDYTGRYTESNGKVIRVEVVCKQRGAFWQALNNHKTGHGCRLCKNDGQKSSTERFIKESKDVHGEKYDYSKSVYRGCKEKVTVTCREHGDFTITPSHHKNGQGCQACAGNKRGTTDEFIKKSKEVHGDAYDYSKSEYKGSNKEIVVICKRHGEFKTTPSRHTYGRGCQRCCEEDRKWRLNSKQLDLPYTTYLLKIKNKDAGNTFYKIGITGTSIDQRFKAKSYRVFDYEILEEYRDIGRKCEEFEDELLTHLKVNNEYRKVKDFKEFGAAGGWTECFEGDRMLEDIQKMFEIKNEETFK